MSVPSIFSRLYEHANAFEQVVGNLHNDTPYVDNEAEQLVSQWLDLLELIYMYSREVNVFRLEGSDLQQLHWSHDYNHQFLATIIQEDLNSPKFNGVNDWYLFCLDGIVLGGTSPMTLVYTSPDVKQKFEVNGLVLSGTNGNRLFYDVVPLLRRGLDFKQFMYEYRCEFNLPQPIRDYISVCMQIDHINFHHISQSMTVVYETIVLCYTQSGDVPILCIPANIQNSDYVLIPGKPVERPLPLVLSPQGLPGAKYIYGIQWNSIAFSVPEHISYIPLEDRFLPGTRIKYPFICSSDFLEGKIIQLSSDIDNRRFITCCHEKSRYLLPIRRLYFEFFTLEDLNNHLSVEHSESENSVVVRLTIPVSGGVIEFHRVYRDDDIVKLNINIAITPVYQLDDETYHLLYSKDTNIELQIGNTNSTDIVNGISHTTRYQNDHREIGCYTIRNSWDYLRICFHASDNNAVEGFACPLFMRPYVGIGDSIFSVDMADSYTSIMHGHPHAIPQALSIDERIVGILCHEDRLFRFAVKRFFIDVFVFDTARMSSPCKNLANCTHDVRHNPQNGSFLENYNIVLDYDMFSENGDECLVRPSLYDISHPLGMDSLRTYFEGLLFFMKQESLLRYNSQTFELRVSVPSNLNVAERDRVQHIWKEARQTSGTGVARDTIFISNSVALAKFTHFAMALPEDFVNIHIDSWHTHFTYCDNVGRCRTICVDMGIGNLFEKAHPFGGDDVPFVRNILQQYLHGSVYSHEETQIIDTYIQHYRWSLFDVFESESDIQKKRFILNCGQLGACALEVETIYLIGLFYYLAKYLDEMNLRQPHTVVFSGLGVTYLTQCFGYARSVERLFDSVIQLIQGDDYEHENTRILFYDNPTQVTSKGLMMDGMELNETIDCFYGLEDNANEPIRLHEIIDTNVRDDMHRTFQHFIDMLASHEIRDVLFQELDISLDRVMRNINNFAQMAINSVDLCINENMEVNGPEGRCGNALFFWNLKHSLYDWLRCNC